MKSLGRVLVIFCSMVFSFSQAEVQQTPSSEQIPQHRQDSAVKSQNSNPKGPQPSAELQSLIKALSGKWAVDIRYEPNPEMPNGFAATGQETWRAGPGGFTLLEEEHYPTPAGDLFLLTREQRQLNLPLCGHENVWETVETICLWFLIQNK